MRTFEQKKPQIELPAVYFAVHFERQTDEENRHMNMNTKSAVLGIAIAISAATNSITVAEPGGMGGMPGGQGRMAPPTPEQRVDHMVSRMTEHLNLTTEQQTELKGIFMEQNEKHKQVSEETQTRVQSVLTDEQKQKLEASRPGSPGGPRQGQPPMR